MKILRLTLKTFGFKMADGCHVVYRRFGQRTVRFLHSHQSNTLINAFIGIDCMHVYNASNTTISELSQPCYFLADRTNGRAIGTVFRLSVCRRLSVTLCIVAKLCVLEQKLLLRAYRKSYMRNRLVPK